MILGIDVSSHQDTTPPLTDLDFLFARATYGVYADTRYALHIANARKAGLVTGAYHFARHGDVPGQVAEFLAAAKDADLLALDLESDGGNPAMTQAEASAFIAAVQASGRAIGLYHSESGYPSLGQDFRWIAKWGTTPPSSKWEFWQYQGSPTDRDEFNGTLDELHALAGATTNAPNQGDGVPDLDLTRYPEDAPRSFTSLPGLKVLRRFTRGGETTGIPTPYSGAVDREVAISGTGVPHGAGFLRLAGGGSSGYFILAAEVTVAAPKPPVDTTPFTQADLDAAKAAEHERTRDAAIAAVTALK